MVAVGASMARLSDSQRRSCERCSARRIDRVWTEPVKRAGGSDSLQLMVSRVVSRRRG